MQAFDISCLPSVWCTRHQIMALLTCLHWPRVGPCSMVSNETPVSGTTSIARPPRVAFGSRIVAIEPFCRYWEGITFLKQMHSKWFDACVQTLSFDSCMRNDTDLRGDAFCASIVRANPCYA